MLFWNPLPKMFRLFPLYSSCCVWCVTFSPDPLLTLSECRIRKRMKNLFLFFIKYIMYCVWISLTRPHKYVEIRDADFVYKLEV